MLACETEVAHKLSYFTQYTDLVVRGPDEAGVPVLLVEVDRGSEPVAELVAKVRRYAEWFELLAPKADAKEADRARRSGGADVNGFRLWSRVYPATGREGYPPLAFVFTGTTPAQRASRIQRLKDDAWPFIAGRYYDRSSEDITAVDYHQAVPVVVTELEQLDAHGAGAPVWQRLGRHGWQTLTDALDNPKGDRLHEAERAERHRRAEERRAAHRESRRPKCAWCKAKFTDERWEQVEDVRSRGARHSELCGPCADAARIRDDGDKRMRGRDAELAAAVQARLAEQPGPGRRR
ncbi:hypothetical protein OG216_47850 (plasmid) [Streptomycetaceae bacterium NBC_01309]